MNQSMENFKLELAKEWLMLQTHKWRRPKWVKFPRSMLDDARWIRLSDEARSAWMSILLIASENPNSELPAPDILFRRFQALGNCFQAAKFERIILELIQCGFLLKTTPELQSNRVTELQSPLLRNADLAVGEEEIRREEVGEEERMIEAENSPPLGQSQAPHRKLGLKRLIPTSEVLEIIGVVPQASATSTTTPAYFTYEEAMARSLVPPVPRFEKKWH